MGASNICYHLHISAHWLLFPAAGGPHCSVDRCIWVAIVLVPARLPTVCAGHAVLSVPKPILHLNPLWPRAHGSKSALECRSLESLCNSLLPWQPANHWQQNRLNKRSQTLHEAPSTLWGMKVQYTRKVTEIKCVKCRTNKEQRPHSEPFHEKTILLEWPRWRNMWIVQLKKRKASRRSTMKPFILSSYANTKQVSASIEIGGKIPTGLGRKRIRPIIPKIKTQQNKKAFIVFWFCVIFTSPMSSILQKPQLFWVHWIWNRPQGSDRTWIRKNPSWVFYTIPWY